MRPFRPTLLAAASTAPLLGCVAKPVGTPIVLNPPSLTHRAAQHGNQPQQRRPAATATRTPAPLTPAQKDALFRDFDTYLHESGTD